MEACSPQTLGRACGSALFPIMKEPHTDMLAIENGHKFIVQKISIFYWAMIVMESLAIILQIIQIIHLQFRQETSGSVHLLPVPCPLSQSRGSPASVISPSASTCILANSEGQPSQVGKSRRITHSPRFFGCDQSHNCLVHILTSPPGEGVLQRRIDT